MAVSPTPLKTEPGPTQPVRDTSSVRPPVPATTMKRRHWGIVLSFALWIAIPLVVAAFYLYRVAEDQFASTVGFSVRTEEFSSPIELFGGITDFGSSGAADADILEEFIQSQEIVETLDARLDLRSMFSLPEFDPVFAYDPTGSIEDLHAYWQRMVRVLHDGSTDLIEVRARAFDPADARAITVAIFDESARLVDELSQIAQVDTTRFARDELDRAVERLKLAREQITQFRSRTQIVDPSADLQGQMGLLGTLEQQLAGALIDADILRETTREGDIRLAQADRRIAVIEKRIAEERQKLGMGAAEGENAEDYATLISEFERLSVDREFAEQSYVAALAAFDQAQSEARRKSRYLVAYLQPTRAETAQYPDRPTLLGLIAFLLVSTWGIAVLLYYSLRDRR